MTFAILISVIDRRMSVCTVNLNLGILKVYYKLFENFGSRHFETKKTKLIFRMSKDFGKTYSRPKFLSKSTNINKSYKSLKD